MSMHVLRLGQQVFELAQPWVMSIINVTPDSYFSGSRAITEGDILEKAETALIAGAQLLDVGGYSTRPGATEVSEAEELQRVIPAIQAIKRQFPEALISVDTFRQAVAAQAIDAGAVLVNDVSAGTLDPAMWPWLAAAKPAYVCMHMRGTPQTMNSLADYTHVTQEVLQDLASKQRQLLKMGLTDVIMDPGFGFAKTATQGYQMLRELPAFQLLQAPILVGISRKRMIYQPLGLAADTCLEATTALHLYALQQGAHILRVHDTAQAVQAVKLHQLLTTS